MVQLFSSMMVVDELVALLTAMIAWRSSITAIATCAQGCRRLVASWILAPFLLIAFGLSLVDGCCVSATLHA